LAKQILHIDKEALDALVKRKVEEAVADKIREKEHQLKKERSLRKSLEKKLQEQKHKFVSSDEPKYFYKSKVKISEDESKEWLVTYSDVVTLLLTLFVLLLSFSDISVAKFEEVKSAIDKDLIKKEKVVTTFNSLKEQMVNIFKDFNLENSVSVKLDPRGLKINLASNSLYDLGSAEIKPTMFPVLKKIAETIKASPVKNYMIEVDGHTDNIPIVNSPKYDSNWELSANRATNVVKYFISLGIPPSRLRAAGYADTHPLVPNTDAQGNPIPENQAKNRRVEIIIERTTY
jgi:chemotaxis protein MotB